VPASLKGWAQGVHYEMCTVGRQVVFVEIEGPAIRLDAAPPRAAEKTGGVKHGKPMASTEPGEQGVDVALPCAVLVERGPDVDRPPETVRLCERLWDRVTDFRDRRDDEYLAWPKECQGSLEAALQDRVVALHVRLPDLPIGNCDPGVFLMTVGRCAGVVRPAGVVPLSG
jgi:hypothetical protein